MSEVPWDTDRGSLRAVGVWRSDAVSRLFRVIFEGELPEDWLLVTRERDPLVYAVSGGVWSEYDLIAARRGDNMISCYWRGRGAPEVPLEAGVDLRVRRGYVMTRGIGARYVG